MKSVQVHFENGDSLHTEIDGSEEDIREYYLHRYFNLGIEGDHMVRCVDVEILG